MIELKKVRFVYQDQNQQYEALSSINLTIRDGEFVCVVGPSGCGKTTLLRLIAGLQVPTEGELLINGKPVAAPREDTAIVFQDYALFPWMTARKNVAFAVRHSGRKLSAADATAIADRFLSKVGMLEAAGKYPYQMSGGMRQRVAIARALAMDREILLLDEPFGALDARNRTELQGLLEILWGADLQARKTVVFVTHDIAEAVRLADRIVLMQPGAIAEEIEVALSRPRAALTGKDADSLKTLRRDLTDKLIENNQSAGKGCRCGGPA